MKKIWTTCSLIIAVVLMCGAMVFATDDLDSLSDQNHYDEFEDDGSISVDDYDDYLSVAENGYTQSELKEYYQEYTQMLSELYDTYERIEPVRAKVKDILKRDRNYTADYYSVYENQFQTVVVEILNGTHKGEELEMNYLLTTDVLGNIQLAEVRIGDVLLLNLEEEEGTLTASMIGADVSVERFNWLIALAILTVLFIIIYAGKNGIKFVIFTLLIFDLVFLFIVPGMVDGISIFFLTAFSVLAIIITNVVLKQGVTKKALLAGISAILVVIFAVFLIFGFDLVARVNGNTFETATLADNIIKRNVDFHDLFMMTIALIVSVIASNTSCKIADIIERRRMAEFYMNDTLKESQEVLASQLSSSFIVMIVMLISKYLLLVAYKYWPIEIMNSELLTCELSRLFVVMLSTTITAPFTILLGRYLYPKEEVPKIVEKNVQE